MGDVSEERWRLFSEEGIPTFPDVHVDEQGAELVAGLCVGVDFGGETGWGAVLGSRSVSTHNLVKVEFKAYRLCHFLNQPIHNCVAELLVAQIQSKEIRHGQPDPLAILVRFIIAVVGVVLIAMGIVGEQLAGVEEVAIDLEGLVRGVHGVKVDRQTWVGLSLGSGEDVEGFDGKEGGVNC